MIEHIGMVGLGRMGANMTRRMLKAGVKCTVYNRSEKPVKELEKVGAQPSTSLADLVKKLSKPRVVWLMVPAGEVTEKHLVELSGLLEGGDVIIDGGNTFYKDDVRRAKKLKEKGIFYVDVGTSGGVWGLVRGYSLMIGGEEEIVKQLDPVFKALAPGRTAASDTQERKTRTSADEGYLHCGPVGAGHFVKMVHNGIEYGLMQAYAEGFDIMRQASSKAQPEDFQYDLNLAEVAEVWRRGSVVASWLLDLTSAALAEDPKLEGFEGMVPDSGEGRWTVNTAVELAVPADVLSSALYARFRSRQGHTFGEKVLSAMRAQFGGHKEK